MKEVRSRRPGAMGQEPTGEIPENLVCGRNELRELLASGKTIDKVFAERGEHTGSIGALLAEVRERKIPIVSVDRVRLDAMTGGARHQGIAALVAARAYATIEDILAVSASRRLSSFAMVWKTRITSGRLSAPQSAWARTGLSFRSDAPSD